MNKPNRHLAFLSYLLSVPGWLYVFLFRREDDFVVYHAKQSMMLTIVAIGAPVVWGLVAWLVVLFVPLLGPITAAALFSLVILLYVFLAVAWVIGMVRAWRTDRKPLPVVGNWAERIPIESQAA